MDCHGGEEETLRNLRTPRILGQSSGVKSYSVVLVNMTGLLLSPQQSYRVTVWCVSPGKLHLSPSLSKPAPSESTPSSRSSTRAAGDPSYRVVKLQSIDLPCDSSSFLSLRSPGNALLRLKLVLIIRLGLAYYISGEPYCGNSKYLSMYNAGPYWVPLIDLTGSKFKFESETLHGGTHSC